MGGCWVRRNLIFWNQQTTKTLSVFAREKRNAQQAPIAAERSALLSLFFAEKEASLEFQSGVFSLSPFVGGVNRSKVFPSFLSRCFYLNPIVKNPKHIFVSFVPSLKREKTSAFSTSNTSRAVYLCTFLRLLSQLE
jgi:hypothetical protein